MGRQVTPGPTSALGRVLAAVVGVLLTAAAIFATVAFFAVAVTLVVAAIILGLGLSLWMRWRRRGSTQAPPRAGRSAGPRPPGGDDIIDVESTVVDDTH